MCTGAEPGILAKFASICYTRPFFHYSKLFVAYREGAGCSCGRNVVDNRILEEASGRS